MKEVISKNELYELILKSVNIICDSVSSTLGPCGNNVLINKDDTTPFITNDGVTIASAIESQNIKINSILEIIKESSLKTNEDVGDGTTTTLVLLKSLINDGIKEIKLGKNPFILKKELNIVLNKIINEIKRLKMKPTKKDLLYIANTSSNDKEIGKIIYDVFLKMKNKYSIKLLESNNEKTYYEIKKGYLIDIDNMPNLYFNNSNIINLKDVYILIIRDYLENIEQISDIINECYQRNKNIVIFADEYNESIIEQLILFNIKDNKNIYLFKTPDYGSRKIEIEKDISLLSNANIKNVSFEKIKWCDIGHINSITITKNNITIFNDNKNIKNRIKELKNESKLTFSQYEKEEIESRISKLNKGIAYIYVGGNTKTEIKEKLMRFEDALNAIDSSYNGIVYGEGITYLKISDTLNDNIISEKIVKNALQKPFQKIFENAGIDYTKIKNDIIKSNYKKIYNFDLNKLENIENSNIIDPINVSICAITNAICISSILLTTNYLVINENNQIKKFEF